MHEAARPGEGLEEMRFDHVGYVDLPEGRFAVCEQFTVIEGMLSPRGQRRLLFFDARNQIVESWDTTNWRVLWCEEARIYLQGGVGPRGIMSVDPKLQALFARDEEPSGNVIDLSRGLHHPVLTAENRYGSSGGIEADPWKPK